MKRTLIFRTSSQKRSQKRGQVVMLFALSAIAIGAMLGLVIDGGMAYRQERIQSNAAAIAARAATVYLAENKASASDADVECVVALYTSAAEYQSFVNSNQCLADASAPDNQGYVDFNHPLKGSKGAWYIDFNGNELIAVGAANSALPVVSYLKSADGYQVAGIRVYSAVDSGTYFIRLVGIDSVHIAAAAAARTGSVNTFNSTTPQNVSLPNPGGGTQTTLTTFPAAFSQQSYQAAGLQNPANNPTPQNFPVNNGSSGFYWSSLQCQSNSNSDTKTWLQGQDPCPAAGSSVAATGTPNSQCANSGPGPTSCISTQPGIRAVDYRLADAYVGKIVIIPIVQDATNESQNPIVQFAYFYLTGENAQGANGYISGYFIDPSTLPVISGPIGSGSGPGGVGGVWGDEH